MKRDLVLLTIIVAFVALLGVYFWVAPKAPDLAYRPIEISGGSITVMDQEQFDHVTLDAEIVEPGWITIHETMGVAQGAAAPAEIIGTSDYLEAAMYMGMTINLSQPMNPGAKYTAILHVDNGDQQYVTEDDMPVSVNGAVVRPDFIAVGPPSEDETTDEENADDEGVSDEDVAENE